MKNECEIVRDLLPLYFDNLCSESTKKYVEEHIEQCEECRNMVVAINEDKEETVESINIPDEATILNKTSWTINKKAIICSVGITVIILYWLVYFWQIELANYGIYKYFSYSVHEAYSIGYIVVPTITAIWLITVIIKTIKTKCLKKNSVLCTVLSILLFLQVWYLYDRSKIVYCDIWTEVVSIPDECHIVIDNGEMQITLETTPNITCLLKDDGTIYGFSYEIKNGYSDGVLYRIWNPEE